MTGLTSVTFRKLSRERILALANEAGLDGVEWGGDIHVPAGDTASAAEAARLTAEAGLAVLSYGSYYRAGCGQEFAPVLASGAALGAPLIRVWAGNHGSSQADDAYFTAVADDLAAICDAAAAQGIAIGLEYHRNTLTDTWQSASRLLGLAGRQALTTYWQPNPELTVGEHHREIEALLPRISSVHVFHWRPDGSRLPLSQGWEDWRGYRDALGGNRDYILEFVAGDDENQFLQDAKALLAWA